MEAYVFVSVAGPTTIERLMGLKGVRIAKRLYSGSFQAIAFLEGETPSDIIDSIRAVRLALPNVRTDVALQIPPPQSKLGGPPPRGPTKLLIKPTYVTYVRVRVTQGRRADVLFAAAEIPSVEGTALVSGTYDVLVEAASDDPAAITDVLVSLQSLEGVSWTDSNLAIFPPPGA